MEGKQLNEAGSRIFREKTLKRISSPDELSEYLHVTSPGVWLVLLAVILLLAGTAVWSAVGSLETTVQVQVSVEDGRGSFAAANASLEPGMTLRVGSYETKVESVETDAYGRSAGEARVSLQDGMYDGEVVTETVHPISFLLESR